MTDRSTPRIVTVQAARRLNLARQHLTGAPPPLLDVIHDMTYVQLDPISAVARSHEIVLWSRCQDYDPAELERLRFETFHLIEYWAHAAAVMLTADYPLFAYHMRHYAAGDRPRDRKLRDWAAAHEDLRQHILGRLRQEGPLPSRAINSLGPRGVGSTGWTSGRDITHMIDYLWHSGQIMVAGREGTQRLWGLTEQFLPAWALREALPPEEITYRAVQRALRSLGVATAAHIRGYFLKGRYVGLAQVIEKLEADGVIQRVQVTGSDGEPLWKAPAYIHAQDLELLERIEAGDFAPRTTLLSPFDNLITDRGRTEQLWSFHYRVEIYVPKDRRQYGYYVLPILHGDRLIGRLDPTYDAGQAVLTIQAVYHEPDAPDDPETVAAIRGAIESLARRLGAKRIDYVRVPPAWRSLANG